MSTRLRALRLGHTLGVTLLVGLVLSASQPALAQVGSSPATPARPTVASVTHDAVSITWTDPGDSSITDYQVLRRNPAIHDPGVFGVIEDDTGSSDTSYEDTDVTPETSYVYRVKARNAHGLSGRSSYVNATTPADTTPPNTAPTGQPAITGTAQVGETLRADTSGISDTNGLTNVQYTYQWVRNDGAADTDISGATAQTYTLTSDDQGNTVKVTVSFTDDDGYVETLTSAAMSSVASRPNSAATGMPTITGAVHVGGTLTADTSGIADTDGMNNATFSYQWVANDGSSDTDIPGATNPTYILLAAEEGKSIKVRVSFTDDSDNDETLTSDATAVAAAEVDMIWSVEMLVKDYGNSSLGAYSASLQKLALSNNQLTGTIPTELGDLADTLTELSMANNGFTGCIPPA